MFTWLWKSKCTMKIKVFGWLLMHDRLNTRNMLKRRHFNIGDDLDCLLCGCHVEETISHMIFSCPFSTACWDYLGITWPSSGLLVDWIAQGKTSSTRPLFLEIFFVAAWSLWKERNNNYFRGIHPSFSSWKQRFIEDFSLLTHRAKEKHRPFISSFVASLQ